jgi:hypothetical protein
MAGPPLFACPPPTVAAINGHADAGGLITPLGCDNRARRRERRQLRRLVGPTRWGPRGRPRHLEDRRAAARHRL